MNKPYYKHLPWRFAHVFAVSLLLWAVPFAGSYGQGVASPADEEKLIQRLKQEIMKDLEEGKFLKRRIELGIQDYVRKQAKAQRRQQAAARAKAAREARNRAKLVRRVSPNRDHIRGNPAARISLIEYSDFECPFCKRFHPTAQKALDANDGMVNWVYRHFPLAFHDPNATKQAEAAECAAVLGGPKAFWAYSDAIYARTNSNGKGFPLTELAPLAREVGLDAAGFDDCLKSGRMKARIKQDVEDGKKIGISGTPNSILIDNKTGAVRIVSGAVPLAQLQTKIDELLKTSVR